MSSSGINIHCFEVKEPLRLLDQKKKNATVTGKTVQNRAKNTSNVHRSSHSYAHTIILYVAPIIQMLTITT